MRPATIASMEVDGLKPARLLVVALLTFVLTVSASVAVAASRVALVVGNGTYAHRPPPAAGFGVTVARAAQDPSAVEAALGLDRPTRRLIQQGLRNEGFDAGTPDGLFGPRTRAAIRAWQAAREQAETGYLDGAQAAALRAAASPPAAVASDPEAGTNQVAGSPGASERQVATAAPPPAANGLAAPAVVESPPAPAAAVINPEDEDNAPAAQAARSTQLPPEILVDRRLLRVERLLAADNHQAAHDVMNEIIALEREHDVALPAEFPFRFAQVAFAAGLAETAVEYVNEYRGSTSRGTNSCVWLTLFVQLVRIRNRTMSETISSGGFSSASEYCRSCSKAASRLARRPLYSQAKWWRFQTSAQPSPPVSLRAPRSKQYVSPVGSASTGVGSPSSRHRSMKCS